MTQTSSLSETQTLAAEFVKKLMKLKANEAHAAIVGLHGDLGSGKTTFVQSVAKALGVEQTITSPTFVIEKIYPIKPRSREVGASKLQGQPFDHLVHIDAYRLESADELLHLGWEDIATNPKNLIFIEWPERVQDILPQHTQTIRFAFIDETTREIVF